MIEHPSKVQCQWPTGCSRWAAGYDHDHDTDRVRAALCAHHNSTLRSVGDTPSSLRAVADWLESTDMGFTYTEWTRENRLRYDIDHREQLSERRRQYNAAHREERAAYNRQWRSNMKGKLHD